MRIAITGAEGFIGRNLDVRLGEAGYTDIARIVRGTSREELPSRLADVNIVFHLAGVNRPADPAEFTTGNADFTAELCDVLAGMANPPRIVVSSSTQAALDNPYGQSKRRAEEIVEAYGARTGASIHIFRLTNVFGKWSRPNYNSAVATFCHNIAHGLSITIDDPAAPLRLVYVDDVIEAFLALARDGAAPGGFVEAAPVYETTVGAVANMIRSFAASRDDLTTPPVGTGLARALHATYLSFLAPVAFTYTVPVHTDPRGSFVEMLKTRDSGQFSYFTAHPGITRGEHYHHSKTEKFLVIKGTASFGFRQIVTGDTFELVTRGGDATIVETIPGWAHNVTNIGDDELIVMLWANEIFDRSRPDTIAAKVKP
ncbi:UDP-2-acetamido-2,6-beta-L-arabino-hexul-4-ose reductase [Pseudorhizobium tarimense]|uniref:UDP-2-acetamido-2,6-beta-L-arabino-hexul-4-ose reductase n=1 Tax=Pseudorhizobium tarimense TaxID=1079109 RepID=A0ABV2H5Q0_9HYPH|nr:NAD-dependent epimerase/dehydratase family protein [Pseudorhizobium tarimense]MCJ8519282.1 NAD-dependent epimerase/dehydratase family protein [Pseudorhizobium tarimense]